MPEIMSDIMFRRNAAHNRSNDDFLLELDALYI